MSLEDNIVLFLDKQLLLDKQGFKISFLYDEIILSFIWNSRKTNGERRNKLWLLLYFCHFNSSFCFWKENKCQKHNTKPLGSGTASPGIRPVLPSKFWLTNMPTAFFLTNMWPRSVLLINNGRCYRYHSKATVRLPIHKHF